MSEPVNLLLLDDDVELADALSSLLAEDEIKVKMFNSATDALEFLKHSSADAIISDFKMPEMTGIQFLSKIRELGLGTPFVLMTAFPDEEAVYSALRLGAFDIIKKPTAIDEISRILKRAIGYGVAEAKIRTLTAGVPGNLQKDLDLQQKQRSLFRLKNFKERI